MPNEEILQLILTELKGLKEGQARLEQEMVGVNKRLDNMEAEMHDIKEDVQELKEEVHDIKEKVYFTADVVDQSLKMQDNLEVRVVELEKAI